MAKGRLTGLDGLRGIAALAVLLHHVFVLPHGKGFLAVDFFFMLSGYVMARTYEPRMAEPGGWQWFMRERLRRLYPVVFFASLLCLPWLVWFAGADAWWIALLNLLLIPTPALGQLYLLNPPVWSIVLELAANFSHAIGLRRIGNRALGLMVVAMLPLLAWFTAQGQTESTTWFELLAVGPVRVLVPYGIGILLHRLWRDEPPVRIPASLTWLAMPAYFIFATFAPWNMWWADFLFVVALCPLLLAGGLCHGTNSRLAAFAGELSFPLYAIHAAVLLPMKALGVGWIPQLTGSLAAGWLFVLTQRSLSERRRARRTSSMASSFA